MNPARSLALALDRITSAPDALLRDAETDLRSRGFDTFDPATEAGADDDLLDAADAIDCFIYARRKAA